MIQKNFQPTWRLVIDVRVLLATQRFGVISFDSMDRTEFTFINKTAGSVLTLDNLVLPKNLKEGLMFARFEVACHLLNPSFLEQGGLSLFVNADIPEPTAEPTVWNTLKAAARIDQNRIWHISLTERFKRTKDFVSKPSS